MHPVSASIRLGPAMCLCGQGRVNERCLSRTSVAVDDLERAVLKQLPGAMLG
jgi:hypothetical protein